MIETKPGNIIETGEIVKLTWEDIVKMSTPPLTNREAYLLEVLEEEIKPLLDDVFELGALWGKKVTSAGLYQLVPHNLIRTQELTHQQKAVFIEVCSYSWGSNPAFPSVKTMVEDLGGIATKTVHKALKTLTEAGYLRKVPRPGHTNLYYPTTKAWGTHEFTEDEKREFGIGEYYQ